MKKFIFAFALLFCLAFTVQTEAQDVDVGVDMELVVYDQATVQAVIVLQTINTDILSVSTNQAIKAIQDTESFNLLTSTNGLEESILYKQLAKTMDNVDKFDNRTGIGIIRLINRLQEIQLKTHI